MHHLLVDKHAKKPNSPIKECTQLKAIKFNEKTTLPEGEKADTVSDGAATTSEAAAPKSAHPVGSQSPSTSRVVPMAVTTVIVGGGGDAEPIVEGDE